MGTEDSESSRARAGEVLIGLEGTARRDEARGNQQLLREVYLSSDQCAASYDAARPWCVGTALEVSPASWGDLDRLGVLLPDEGKELLPGWCTTAMKMVEQGRAV